MTRFLGLRAIALCSAVIAAPAWAGAASLSDLQRGNEPGALSFAGAREALITGSDQLRAAGAEVEARQQQALADKGLNHPTVTLDTRMVWGSKTVDLGVLDAGGKIASYAATSPAIGPLLKSLGPAVMQEVASLRIPLHYKMDIDGPRSALQATWVLYSGGRISAKQAASEAAAREASSNLRSEADSLEKELAEKYFGVQLARAVTTLRSEALKSQQREVDRAVAFEKAGTLSRLERMSVEVNRDKARRDLLASESDEKVARAELARLVRSDVSGKLSTPLFVIEGDIGPLEAWQQEALASSPVVASYGAKTEQARELVKAAKGAWMPTVYAFGEKNLIKHYLTIPEPDWMAGIGVKFTLWNNHDRSADLAAARAVEEKALAGSAEVRSRLASGVEVAWLRTNQMRDLYRLTRSTVSLAEENLRMREAAFAQGLTTANELWDARTKLTGARVEQKVAAYKFVVAWAALNAAAGTMPKFMDSLSRSDRTVEQ